MATSSTAPPAFDQDEVYRFTVQLARDAGKLMLEGLEKRSQNTDAAWDELHKKNSADLVTEVDQNTEAFVKERIASTYPGYLFLGEESWAAGEHVALPADTGCFVVDPVDGTTNAVHGFPFFCISIGFCWRTEPVVGVVYAPLLDTLFSAQKGKGAFVETPVQRRPRRLPLPGLMPLPSLRQAVAAVEWGSDRRLETVAKKSESFKTLCGDAEAGVKGGQMLQGVRSIGSAALSCCYVAQGSMDLWHEYGCWAWDVCAGIVIVQEAGGVVVGGKQQALAAVRSLSSETTTAAAAAPVQGASPSLPSSPFGKVTPELLQGRRYLVVRPVPDTPQQSGRQAQAKIVKDFYEAIDEWDLA